MLQQFWLTKENAGSQQAHVRRAEVQVAARCRQEKWHAENLHGVAGVGPAAHEQEQPVEQAKTFRPKQKASLNQTAPVSVCFQLHGFNGHPLALQSNLTGPEVKSVRVLLLYRDNCSQSVVMVLMGWENNIF